MLRLAKASNENQGLKAENIDFSLDIRSKSTVDG